MADLREILMRSTTIGTVGASTNRAKPAGEVPQYLKEIGFHVIPVNPKASEIFGERSYPSLLDIEEPVDVVQVFRPSKEAPDIARQAVQLGAKALWLRNHLAGGADHRGAGRPRLRGRPVHGG